MKTVTSLSPLRRQAKRSKVEGRIDGLAGQGVSGWAWRPAAPEERLWIEAFADGCSLGVARAEHFHPGSADRGDGCYGFWLPVPAVLLEQPLEVNASVANTGETFAPSLFLKGAGESSRLSQVLYDAGLRVSGWAIDAARPERKVNVSAWYEGKKLVGSRADRRRFKPHAADGHGFEMNLPLRLADGRQHYVDILDDNDNSLVGSPVLIQALPEKTSAWLAGVKVGRTERKLLEQVLKRYEDWLPGSAGFACYSEWKECFPGASSLSAAVGGESVALCSAETSPDELRRLSKDHAALLLLDEGTEAAAPQASGRLIAAATACGSALAYGDSEIGEAGGLVPHFKPAWDEYLFCGQDYLGPILVRSGILDGLRLPGPVSPIELRTLLILEASRHGICHVPEVLSRSGEQAGRAGGSEERRRLIKRWLGPRHNIVEVTADPLYPNLDLLNFDLRETPLVSIIIPTRDRADLLGTCLQSLWETSTYPRIEILIIDNGSVRKETLGLLRRAVKRGARVLSRPGPFNYAALNNQAAGEAAGEVLCFLNNDTQVLSPDWLHQMLVLLQHPDAGAVGAKLLWANGLVQHGGVVVGPHQLAAHVGNGWTAEEPGYFNRNQLIQQWSAVTAACMLTPKELFLDSGSFDSVSFPVAFNDVDYCLRLRKHGKKILWTPRAQLMHHESASRGKDVSAGQTARSDMEMHRFRTRWGYYDDPFYNPNLTLSAVGGPFDGLALPPRERRYRL